MLHTDSKRKPGYALMITDIVIFSVMKAEQNSRSHLIRGWNMVW